MQPTTPRLSLVRRVAALWVMLLSAACLPTWPHSARWRSEQEALIGSAILEDLVAMPGDDGEPRATSFCVFARSDAPGDHDPDLRLVALLRSRGIDAYPISQCDGWTVIPTRADAYIVGLESLEWRGDDFVKAEGEVRRGVLSGGTWLYTLSRTKAGWTVDTVRINKIA